jgi:pyruvate dehydrogenase E2 component (dihydrolipoamide acetyltransferase)
VAEQVFMPRLSDTMEEGTVARWVKHEGEPIAEGDVLAEIETDKATMELHAYVDGVLLKILVADGETAPLGTPIAVVGDEGEPVPDALLTNGAPAAEPSVAEPPATERPQRAAAPAADVELRASPIARRMAGDAGVDLRVLAGRGSGPDGRVVKVDVERLIAGGGTPPAGAAAPSAQQQQQQPAPAPPPAGARVEQPSRMLRTVARRMTEAKATVPHFYLESEVDLGRLLELRRELNAALEASGEKVSVNDLVVRACGLALAQHPQFHRSWTSEGLAYHERADVGVAVALDEGLIVPVVRGADRRGVREIARDSRDLAERARAGTLRQDEIEGATFTVSNLGMFGVTRFAAIINPPEPGILAVGAAVERPVVVDGAVVVRPVADLTLSVDHRASSGADGARFLQTVRGLLESGVLLLG